MCIDWGCCSVKRCNNVCFVDIYYDFCNNLEMMYFSDKTKNRTTLNETYL